MDSQLWKLDLSNEPIWVQAFASVEWGKLICTSQRIDVNIITWTAHIGQLLHVRCLSCLPETNEQFWFFPPIHPPGWLHPLPPPTVFIYIFMFMHKHICLTTSCETIISHQDATLSQHIEMLTPVREAGRMTSINQRLPFEFGEGNSWISKLVFLFFLFSSSKLLGTLYSFGLPVPVAVGFKWDDVS